MDGNKGTLSFFVAADSRGEPRAHQDQSNFSKRDLAPAITLTGTIAYDDTRSELLSIQNDPSAIRDTIVASFVDKRGRVAAETVREIGVSSNEIGG